MNKGMFGFPDKRRYQNFYGFPRKRMLKPVGKNFPRNNEDYDFLVDPTSAPIAVNLFIQSFLNTIVIIDWGDGSAFTTFVGNGTSATVSASGVVTLNTSTIQHTYNSLGKYFFKIISGSENVISLSISFGNYNLSGIIKENFALRFPNLEVFSLPQQQTNIKGSIPSNFSNLNFIVFLLHSTTTDILKYEGDFPDTSNWTKLKYFRVSNCNFTTFPSFYNCINLIYFEASLWWLLLTQELPSFENCTQLYNFNISQPYQKAGYMGNGGGFTGTLPSFNNCTQLRTFNARYTNFNGVAPSFSNCTELIIFYLNRMYPVDSTSGGVFTNDIGDLGLQYCTKLSAVRIGGESPTVNPDLMDFSTGNMFDTTNLTALTQLNIYYINSTWVNPTIYSTNILLYFVARGCYNFSGTLTIDSDVVTTLYIDYANISNIDFTNLTILDYTVVNNSPCALTWPLGTKVFVSGTVTTGRFYVDNTGMSNTQINDSINNIYVNRNSFYQTRVKTTIWSGVSNGTPSGTYQAPTGYIQATTGISGNDGSPASAKEQIYVLVNQNNDSTTTKKYNWAFTTN